ncbi:MAG: hypothetical protein U0930_24830 [Pirellulales bacterium]
MKSLFALLPLLIPVGGAVVVMETSALALAQDFSQEPAQPAPTIIVQDSTQGRNFEVEKIAAENGLVGYDHTKQVQKKLLEFVAPMYKEPLVSSQMVMGLSKIDEKEKVSAARQQAADRISLAATSMAELEVKHRLDDQITKLYTIASAGGPTPGMRQMLAASQSAAKVKKNQEKEAELRSNLRLLQTQSEVAFEKRKLRSEGRLKGVREVVIDPTTARMGNGLNVLLDALRPILSQVSLSALDPEFEKLLGAQKMLNSDISKIQLRIDGDAGPLIFSASQGSSHIGSVPVRMQHPSLLPLVKEIENRFDDLRAKSLSRPLFEEIDDLSKKLDSLDAKSDDVLGSAHENAKKGQVQYRAYQQAKEFRLRLRSIVNRMLLEGNTNVLRLPEGKFDPDQHGDRVIDFVRFVVESGCRFSPSNEGDGPAYARLQRSLLELQALLEE